MGVKLRAITRPIRRRCGEIRRRCGEAKQEVLDLTEQTGGVLWKSVNETRKIARGRARGRGARTELKAAAALEGMADRCEKVAGQIRKRVASEPIKEWIVSLLDPDALGRSARGSSARRPSSGSFGSWRR